MLIGLATTVHNAQEERKIIVRTVEIEYKIM